MAEKPWDSTRCMRLLRPLRAHLTALEKEQQRKEDLQAAAGAPKPPTTRGKSSAESPWISRFAPKDGRNKGKRTYSSRCRAQQIADKVAYENRQHHPSITGEIHMPDAFVCARSDAQQHDSSRDIKASLVPATDEPSLPPGPNRTRKSRKLRAFDGVRSEDNLGGLQQSYLAIVHATAPSKITSTPSGNLLGLAKPCGNATGASSLRSMAIRAIARYIDEEEMDQQCLSADSRTDVSDDIYRELDDFSFPKENGQPIQAQLVRAQATKLVCDAIRGGLVSSQFGIALVRTWQEPCFQREACSEADQVLAAVAYGARPDPSLKNCLRESMVPILNCFLATNRLLSNSRGQSRDYLPKDVLRHLIENPSFPVDWLSTTPYMNQWRSVIMDVASHTNQYHDSRRFVTETFAMACGIRPMSGKQLYTLQHVPILALQDSFWGLQDCDNCSHRALREQKKLREAFTTSISSLLTILTSLVLVGSEEYIKVSGVSDASAIHKFSLQNVTSLLHELSCSILESNYEDWIDDQRHAQYYGTRSVNVLFCTLLAETLVDSSEHFSTHDASHIVQLILELDSEISSCLDNDCSMLDELPGLLGSICRASCQISTASETHVLQGAIEALLSLPELPKRSKNFLRHVCRETASDLGFDFGPFECQPTANTNAPFPQKTPAKPRNQQTTDGPAKDVLGYKWEPMLSEWVAATPARPLQSYPVVKIPPLASGYNRCSIVFEDSSMDLVHVKRRRSRRENDSKQQTVIIPDSTSGSELDDATQPSSPPTSISNSPPPNFHQTRNRTTLVQVVIPVLKSRSRVQRLSDMILSSSPLNMAAPDTRDDLTLSSPAPISRFFTAPHIVVSRQTRGRGKLLSDERNLRPRIQRNKRSRGDHQDNEHDMKRRRSCRILEIELDALQDDDEEEAAESEAEYHMAQHQQQRQLRQSLHRAVKNRRMATGPRRSARMLRRSMCGDDEEDELVV